MLLMGGQACIFYGAAEFSRDLDLLVLADAANLPNLTRASTNLGAEAIAVPLSKSVICCAATRSISAATGKMWRDSEST